MTEAEIQAAIRARLNSDGRVRLFRNSCGYDHDKRVRYGLGEGSPDLVGVLRNGRAFCLEVKKPGGRLSPQQVAWWRFARQWGIEGGEVFSVEEAMELLDAATR